MRTTSIAARLGAVGVAMLVVAVATPALANLAPDSIFGGGDGIVTENFNIADIGTAVAAGNGRVFAVHADETDAVKVLAYTPSGTPDISYGGGDGIVDVDMANVYDVHLLPSGKMLLAGIAISDVPGRVVRLTADGFRDQTFGGDGSVSLPYELRGIDVDSQSRIVTGGTLMLRQGAGFQKSDFGVARLRTDGALDTSFSGDGKATVSGDLTDRMTDVAVDSANRPVAVGSMAQDLLDQSTRAMVARFKAGGGLDRNFSGDGVATVALSRGKNIANAVGFGAKDRLVVALSNEDKFGGARFMASGRLDTSYSRDGRVGGDHGGSIYGATVSKGAIFVTGAAGAGLDRIFVGSATASGRLNSDFGRGGKASYDLTDKEDYGIAVIPRPDGVFVTGVSGNSDDNDLLLARLQFP